MLDVEEVRQRSLDDRHVVQAKQTEIFVAVRGREELPSLCMPVSCPFYHGMRIMRMLRGCSASAVRESNAQSGLVRMWSRRWGGRLANSAGAYIHDPCR
jgi:hypothetical protein